MISAGPQKNQRHRRSRQYANPYLSAILLVLLSSLLLACILALFLNRWVIEIHPKGRTDAPLEAGTVYEEPGAKAEVTGTILSFIRFEIPCSVSGSVDTSHTGTYPITYTASYKDLSASLTREVEVADTRAPQITLSGERGITWYTDQGEYQDSYKAMDLCDGDLSDKVTISGRVNVSIPGDYTLTYTVSDTHGNQSQVQRIIHVRQRETNPSKKDWDERTIYLTFDDGPGPYTEELLDLLDRYNVKATFFTTSAFPAYRFCIQEEAARGHTVGVHTYSHDYSGIYASKDAYWQDFQKQNEVIQKETGKSASLFRFAGGSSNTISANYSQGIMSRLVSQAEEAGLMYEDWNVTSGDAGDTTDTQEIVKNVTSQIEANTQNGIPSIVLQHDVKAYSVAAVEDIIQWGLHNGYHFQRITEASYVVHHPINN